VNWLDTLKTYAGRAPSDAAVCIGHAQAFLRPAEWITEKQLNHHVHIVGASGFGKTVLISHILRSRIEGGRGCLFIDQKGDRETIEQFTSYVRAADRLADLKVFSLAAHDNSSSYNLLNNGSATELRDRIMTSLIWSEEYYKNQSAGFLMHLMAGLCWLRDNRSLKIDIELIVRCLKDVEYIAELTKQIPSDLYRIRMRLEEAHSFLSSSDNFKSLQGLRVQLESIAYSDFGDRVLWSDNAIDLFEAVRSGKIVFMFLDTRRFGETARAVGRFIIQDLKAVSAKIDSEIKQSDRKPFTVIIDEFADLAQEDFIGFLDRARSSRIGIVVAHQEISDLDRISPQFCGRLMGNTATLFAFLQKRPESAELISGIGGTKKAWKTTLQTRFFLGFDIETGNRSAREVEEFIVHPNVVKSLGIGECVRIQKLPVAGAYNVTIRNTK
jgi:conjugal transfer pilus assembly protein TraD